MTKALPHPAPAGNMKPADELLTVRQRLRELKDREEVLREVLLGDPAARIGDFALVRVSQRATSRLDRKAAEKALGSLSRFDVKGSCDVLLVDEIIRPGRNA